MPTIVIEYDDETMQSEKGVVVNSHWSDAFGCWVLLVSSESGKLHSVRSDTLGLASAWIEEAPSVVFVDGGDDDEDGYIDEDAG